MNEWDEQVSFRDYAKFESRHKNRRYKNKRCINFNQELVRNMLEKSRCEDMNALRQKKFYSLLETIDDEASPPHTSLQNRDWVIVEPEDFPVETRRGVWFFGLF